MGNGISRQCCSELFVVSELVFVFLRQRGRSAVTDAVVTCEIHVQLF